MSIYSFDSVGQKATGAGPEFTGGTDGAMPVTPAEALVAAAPAAKVMEADTPISRMSQEWQLNAAAKRGRYAVHQLLDNYLLGAMQAVWRFRSRST